MSHVGLGQTTIIARQSIQRKAFPPSRSPVSVRRGCPFVSIVEALGPASGRINEF